MLFAGGVTEAALGSFYSKTLTGFSKFVSKITSICSNIALSFASCVYNLVCGRSAASVSISLLSIFPYVSSIFCSVLYYTIHLQTLP